MKKILTLVFFFAWIGVTNAATPTATATATATATSTATATATATATSTPLATPTPTATATATSTVTATPTPTATATNTATATATQTATPIPPYPMREQALSYTSCANGCPTPGVQFNGLTDSSRYGPSQLIGTMVYCSNCNGSQDGAARGAACVGTGTGSWAMKKPGGWVCGL